MAAPGSGAEGLPAAAGVLRVRVLHLEPGLLEGVDEVERGAQEIEGALVVDDDPDAAGVDFGVAVELVEPGPYQVTLPEKVADAEAVLAS